MIDHSDKFLNALNAERALKELNMEKVLLCWFHAKHNMGTWNKGYFQTRFSQLLDLLHMSQSDAAFNHFVAIVCQLCIIDGKEEIANKFIDLYCSPSWRNWFIGHDQAYGRGRKL